jgi:hypothetical protein
LRLASDVALGGSEEFVHVEAVVVDGDAVAVTRRDRCEVRLVLRDLECSSSDTARAEYRERRFVHSFVIRDVRRLSVELSDCLPFRT